MGGDPRSAGTPPYGKHFILYFKQMWVRSVAMKSLPLMYISVCQIPTLWTKKYTP